MCQIGQVWSLLNSVEHKPQNLSVGKKKIFSFWITCIHWKVTCSLLVIILAWQNSNLQRSVEKRKVMAFCRLYFFELWFKNGYFLIFLLGKKKILFHKDSVLCIIAFIFFPVPNTTVRLLRGGRVLVKNNTASVGCSTEFTIKCLQRLFAIMLAIKVGSSHNLRYFTALSWWELKRVSFSQTLTQEQRNGFSFSVTC